MLLIKIVNDIALMSHYIKYKPKISTIRPGSIIKILFSYLLSSHQ